MLKKKTQLFKSVNNKNMYNQIVSNYIGESVQIDTMDFNAYKKDNKQFQIIF